MYSVLDASMLGLNHPLSVLAPLCAKYGISGLRVPDAALESEAAAGEAAVRTIAAALRRCEA